MKSDVCTKWKAGYCVGFVSWFQMLKYIDEHRHWAISIGTKLFPVNASFIQFRWRVSDFDSNMHSTLEAYLGRAIICFRIRPLLFGHKANENILCQLQVRPAALLAIIDRKHKSELSYTKPPQQFRHVVCWTCFCLHTCSLNFWRVAYGHIRSPRSLYPMIYVVGA